MPRKNDPRLFEEPDDDPRMAQLEAEVMRVRQENDRLKYERPDVVEVRNEHPFDAPLPVLSFRDRPGLFLIALVWAVSGRAFLFAFIEDLGKSAWLEGIAADVVFGVFALWMLKEWVASEWRANQWMVVPRTVLVVVGLIVGATVFGGNQIWDGRISAPGGWETVLALVVTVIALLLAASSAPQYALQKTLRFLERR